MSKNFFDQLNDLKDSDVNVIQQTPAELLISGTNIKEQKESNQDTNKNSSNRLKKALQIIDDFSDLDFSSKQIVFERLKEIMSGEKRILPDADYVNLQQAAEYLNVTIRTIYNYLNDGRLRGIKIKNKMKISTKELKAFSENV